MSNKSESRGRRHEADEVHDEALPADVELECPCVHCTQGVIDHNLEEWTDWREQRRRGLTVDPPRRPERIRCPQCDGTARMPTEIGRKILEFVTRKLRIG